MVVMAGQLKSGGYRQEGRRMGGKRGTQQREKGALVPKMIGWVRMYCCCSFCLTVACYSFSYYSI